MSRAALVSLLALAACRPADTGVEYGAQLFTDARFAQSKANRFSCATCHSTTKEPPPGQLLSGGSLVGVTTRTAFWGGNERRLINAVSFCYVAFMRGPGELDPNEPRSMALYEYLATLGPSEPPAQVPFTVVANVTDVPKTDAARGERVYREACRSCHGELHTGKGRLTELASILPEVKDTYPQLFPTVAPSLVFIEKVRHGQFFGVGGNMPLYSREALSDDDLGALLAYLGF